MPLGAVGLALAAAFVHAFWNLLVARARDPSAATAVAVWAGVLAFAPVALITGGVRSAALPYVVASGALHLAYMSLLAASYWRAELSLVYPLSRGAAPVLVLGAGAVLGTRASAGQALGVLIVVAGILMVRGFEAPHALTFAAAAPVAAVRETSIVVATVFAAAFLKERVTAARLAGAGVVTAGVAVLALA